MKQICRILPLVLLVGLMAGGARAEVTLGWSDLHDGGASLNDEGMSVAFTPDGNVVSAGMHDLGNGYTDMLVRKHDRATGEPIWTFTYADPVGNDVAVSEIMVDQRGDILVAGYLSACDS
ncbi:MAG: hypothetical protein R3D98_17920 [Candidatus Krumholzibacteriia bacterium]